MYKYRLTYEKFGPASFISHLDIMRTFQRIFLRSGFLLQHSSGYHPHPEMSILLPLPVGQTSCCEMIDFNLTDDYSPKEILRKLEGNTPQGISIVSCDYCHHSASELYALSAEINMTYETVLPNDWKRKLDEMLSQEEIPVEKKTKHKGFTVIDIKPRIYSCECTADSSSIQLNVIVSALEPGLNPLYIVKAWERAYPEITPSIISVQRKALLLKNGEYFS